MAKVIEIITDALEDILVQADEAEIPASEARTAIRALNRIMNRLAAKGINLGFTEVSKLSDPVTVPDGALDGITTLLALRLAPKYDKDPSTTLYSQASEGVKAIQRIGITFAKQQMPSTLPMGSGNTGITGQDSCTFYTESYGTISSEFSGSISLEYLTGS